MNRGIVTAALVVLPLILVAALLGYYFATGPIEATPRSSETADPIIGEPLYAPEQAVADPGAKTQRRTVDPVVMPDGRVAVIKKQNVPSQRDGVLLFIGTEVPFFQIPSLFPNQYPDSPDDEVMVNTLTGKWYRELREGMTVQANQLLAQLDNRIAKNEYDIQSGKIIAAVADYEATDKFLDEAIERYNTQVGLRTATSKEELRTAKVTVERYRAEKVSKYQAIGVAQLEREKTQTLVDMHEIRATTPGKIKAIHRKNGEAVKGLEPVFEVYNTERIRIEALVPGHESARLKVGMPVAVEPTLHRGPDRVFIGHLQEVNAVAVTKDKDPEKVLIVSASEDKTVRVWRLKGIGDQREITHTAAVRSVACGQLDGVNWCLSGTADGKGRLWNLDDESAAPRELKVQHRGAITCVAFSPDGRFCATGGEDRDIHMWDTASGERKYTFPEKHRGAVTSLHFTPLTQLVSFGRDNALRLWTLGDKGAREEKHWQRQSGEVSDLGVSPDGRRMLFDQGKELRLMSLPEGRNEDVLRNTSDAATFSAMALFSPDGSQILTADNAEGHLQLWRTPSAGVRGAELRRLVPPERTVATCGAFGPTFVVAGTRNRQVLVWPVPTKEEFADQYTATISNIDLSVESGSRQVRVWADMANPNKGMLRPGDSVTLVAYPK